MSLLTDNLREFMAEPHISERVKFECYLLVALEVRRAGLIMMPAEVPGLKSIGPDIDNEFYWRTTGRRDPNISYVEFASNKLRDTVKKFGKKSVPYKIQLLREIFDQKALFTADYTSHVEWAHKLGLMTKTTEVRPTIREIWIYRDNEAGREIDRLDQLRRERRFEALRNPKPTAPNFYRVFPEEASPEFVRSTGELLGYPPSCLNAYVADRASADGGVEMRAATQLATARRESKPYEPMAYFVKDFFPCMPDCPEAAALGKQALERLTELDKSLGERYKKFLLDNCDTVVHYPEIIKRHWDDLAQRAATYQDEPKKSPINE